MLASRKSLGGAAGVTSAGLDGCYATKGEGVTLARRCSQFAGIGADSRNEAMQTTKTENTGERLAVMRRLKMASFNERIAGTKHTQYDLLLKVACADYDKQVVKSTRQRQNFVSELQTDYKKLQIEQKKIEIAMKIKSNPSADISKEQEFINKSRTYLGDGNNSKAVPECQISTYLNKKNYYPMRYHANPTHTSKTLAMARRALACRSPSPSTPGGQLRIQSTKSRSTLKSRESSRPATSGDKKRNVFAASSRVRFLPASTATSSAVDVSTTTTNTSRRHEARRSRSPAGTAALHSQQPSSSRSRSSSSRSSSTSSSSSSDDDSNDIFGAVGKSRASGKSANAVNTTTTTSTNTTTAVEQTTGGNCQQKYLPSPIATRQISAISSRRETQSQSSRATTPTVSLRKRLRSRNLQQVIPVGVKSPRHTELQDMMFTQVTTVTKPIDDVNDRVKVFIAKLEADNLRRQTAAAISAEAIEEMKAAIRMQHQKAAVSAKSEEYKATRDHWRHLAKAEQERKAKLAQEEMKRAACLKKQEKCAERHSQERAIKHSSKNRLKAAVNSMMKNKTMFEKLEYERMKQEMQDKKKMKHQKNWSLSYV